MKEMKVFTKEDFPAPPEFWEWKEKKGLKYGLKMLRKYGNIPAMEIHKICLEEWKRETKANVS